MNKMKFSVGGLAMVVLLLTACSRGPEPIRYGSDQCVHCKMMITERAFAAEIITAKGKALKFDAIECMAAYITEDPEINKSQVRRWVHDFSEPDAWIQAEEALFVQSKKIKSPMGLSLLAFGDEETLETHLKSYDGTRMTWSEIEDLVRREW